MARLRVRSVIVTDDGLEVSAELVAEGPVVEDLPDLAGMAAQRSYRLLVTAREQALAREREQAAEEGIPAAPPSPWRPS